MVRTAACCHVNGWRTWERDLATYEAASDGVWHDAVFCCKPNEDPQRCVCGDADLSGGMVNLSDFITFATW